MAICRLLNPMSDFGKDNHLSAGDIAAFILGELEPDGETWALEHLDWCQVCVGGLAAVIREQRSIVRVH